MNAISNGVDAIFFDTTNPPFTWKDEYEALCRTYAEMRAEGNETPAIAQPTVELPAGQRPSQPVTQTKGEPMSADPSATCCPRFDPDPWDEKELTWEGKRFVKDRVTSLFHIPLNFGAVMKRNAVVIDRADAQPETMVVLADENSLWGADVYIEVTRDIPGANMVTLSGTFLSKVFEGPYRDMKKWIREMDTFVRARQMNSQKRYFFYATCPKCAKKYGKNYVTLVDQV